MRGNGADQRRAIQRDVIAGRDHEFFLPPEALEALTIDATSARDSVFPGRRVCNLQRTGLNSRLDAICLRRVHHDGGFK